MFEEVLLMSIALSFEKADFGMEKDDLKIIARNFSELSNELERSSEQADIVVFNSFCLLLSDIKSKMLVLLSKGFLEFANVDSTDLVRISRRGWSFLERVAKKDFYVACSSMQLMSGGTLVDVIQAAAIAATMASSPEIFSQSESNSIVFTSSHVTDEPDKDKKENKSKSNEKKRPSGKQR